VSFNAGIVLNRCEFAGRHVFQTEHRETDRLQKSESGVLYCIIVWSSIQVLWHISKWRKIKGQN